ncbi:MAG: hypothetical protein ACFFCQ_11825 [Promethearchaeota archaeon]
MTSNKKKAVFGSICFYDNTSDHVRFLIPPVITENIDKLKLQQTIDSYKQFITLSTPALRKSDYQIRYTIFDVRLQEKEDRLPTRTLFVFNTEIGDVGTWNFLLMDVDDINVSATIEDLQMRCLDVLGVIKRQKILRAEDSTHNHEIVYERIQRAWIIALLHFLKETEEYSEKADEIRLREFRPIGLIEIPLSSGACEEAQRTWISLSEETISEKKKDADLAAVIASEKMEDLKTNVLDYVSLFSKLCIEFLAGVFVAASKAYKIELKPKEILLEHVEKAEQFILLLSSMDEDRWTSVVSCTPPTERYGIAVSRRRQMLSLINRYLSTRRRIKTDQAVQDLFHEFFKHKTLDISPVYIPLMLQTDLTILPELAATPEELEAARQEVLERQELAKLRKFFFEERVLKFILDIIGFSASKVTVEIAQRKGIINEEIEQKYLDIFAEKYQEALKELFGDTDAYFQILLDRMNKSVENAFRKDILERIEGFEEIRKYVDEMNKEALIQFFIE